MPLARERYFFAVERDAVGASPLREVVAILRSDAFRARVDALEGYDATETGRLQTPSEAFDSAAAVFRSLHETTGIDIPALLGRARKAQDGAQS